MSSGSFFQALRRKIKANQIQNSPTKGTDSSGLGRGFAGIVFAECEADVIHTLKCAERHRVAIAPVSTGFNAGYGDHYPKNPNQILLHLGRMARILEFNREEGWMRIEAGVTQQQVAGYLQRNAPEFYFEQTYWLKESSVLGNALERGRTLLTERERVLIGAKLILASGDSLHTGFNPAANSPLMQGMNLHPLIFQTNLGVVVQGILRLQKVSSRLNFFQAGFSSFTDCVQAMKRLNAAGIEGLRLMRWYCAGTFPGARGGQLLFAADRSETRRVRAAMNTPGTSLKSIAPDSIHGSEPLGALVGKGAFSFSTFAVRRSVSEIRKAQIFVNRLCARSRCECFVTISFLDDSAVFLIRAHGDPSQHKFDRAILSAGYFPFRGHSAYPQSALESGDLKKKIKNCFDPKNVISPGKYGLL